MIVFKIHEDEVIFSDLSLEDKVNFYCEMIKVACEHKANKDYSKRNKLTHDILAALKEIYRFKSDLTENDLDKIKKITLRKKEWEPRLDEE